MPSMSSEKSYQALRAIWDKVAVQAPDGKKYLIFKSRTDLDYLYCTGFVDEAKYKPDDWVGAFSDSLMPNGAYMVNEAQWLDKEKFHFWGPVGVPWNPLELREGEWTEAQFRLCHHGIARLDLVIEQIVKLAHVEHRDGRGQLAVRDDVDSVRSGVDAMRAVWDRDIPRER